MWWEGLNDKNSIYHNQHSDLQAHLEKKKSAGKESI